ncbi:chitin deacetylase [Podila clonocystis]|nr:chitin deacetylase [Podila clonocystis]
MAPITRLTAAILVFSSVFVSAVPVLAPLAPNPSFSTDGAYGDSPSTESLQKRASSYAQVYACKTPGTIAITFDDGPYKFTTNLLDELDKIPGSPKVTFFVNGNNNGKITDYASTVKRAYNSGHQIASHTWSHRDLATLKTEDRKAEMTNLDNAVKQIIGKKPTFMRPPYGSVNDAVLNYLGGAGYTIVNWNIDTMDWDHPTNVPKSMKEYQNTIGKSGANKKGWIALQHDPNEQTSKKLGPQAVKYAISKGFKVVTVGTCLGVDKSKWYRS